MNSVNSISPLILSLIGEQLDMKAFAILALYVAVANCARLPVDGVHQVVHPDRGATVPSYVGGVHGQGPVGTGQDVTHDQGHSAHEHDYDHQYVYHGYSGHGQKPGVNKPVHRPIQDQKPVSGGQHQVPTHPPYSPNDHQYYYRPGVFSYNQVPTQGPVHHGHVTNEHGQVVPIGIIQQNMEVNPDGSFHNVWESENGIRVQEEGTVRVIDRKTSAQTVNGQVSYTDYDGNHFHLKYVADEFGFHPVGDHLPTPPPVPLGIARGLEWIAAHPPPKENEDTDEKHVYVESN